MKPTEIKVKVLYSNGKGRFRRVRDFVAFGCDGGVRYEKVVPSFFGSYMLDQTDGNLHVMTLKAFARWARHEVEG